MACPNVEHLLDAFVDTELPPSQLLDVARHAATCSSCDGAIRELASLRQAVAALVDREAAQLDLSGVWPAVETAIAPSARPSTRIVALRRAVPAAAPIWGAVMAIAASAVFWLSGPATKPEAQLAAREESVGRMMASASGIAPSRAMRPGNHADIDRLAGKDIAVRREPKNGTTIIWVNHTVQAER